MTRIVESNPLRHYHRHPRTMYIYQSLKVSKAERVWTSARRLGNEALFVYGKKRFG